ncbi:MAG: hypothetical protein EXR35_07730 [Limnohabitans sp.]|nr:hypothetical protein [Limnohabitans sp.]
MNDTRQVVERELLNQLQTQEARLTDESLQVLLQALFLEQADAIVHRLRLNLGQYVAGEIPQPPVQCNDDAYQLAQLSEERSLSGLAEVAHAMVRALDRSQHPNKEHRPVAILRGAEEIARLLHQFAAGFIKSPQQSVVDDLQ